MGSGNPIRLLDGEVEGVSKRDLPLQTLFVASFLREFDPSLSGGDRRLRYDGRGEHCVESSRGLAGMGGGEVSKAVQPR